ncbi:MAG: transporter, family, fosmidomycin resistance protein [Thermomicrobiales bacterium]|nr:transporter, family, fosmidomycin resistance protein [Thermomicrobiales bacterium]
MAVQSLSQASNVGTTDVGNLPPAAGPPELTGRLDVVRNRPLLTLMLGHLTVDMYAGVLPVLYPLLTEKFDLKLSTVGLVALAYSGMASLSQPLFGWIADRHGTRLIGLSLMWTAATFAVLGFVPNFEMLIVVAALAGIGSGAYHPMGALNASAVIAEGQRNTAMSIYVTGGTLGIAIGPLIGAALFALLGVHGTVPMILPGMAIAVWMLFEMRTISQRIIRRPRKGAAAAPPIPLGPLSVVIGLMMLRAWTMFGIQSFIPSWYENLGYHASFYSALATTLLLTSALGTIGSGSLADRYGRRILLIISSVLSVPCILLFAQFPGWPAFGSAALIGLLAASTGPLLLVIAQQLMAGRAGMASGLILGLGFVMGAIGVPIMGAIADAHGIQNAMRFQAVVAASTIFLAWFLPTEGRIRALIAPHTGAGTAVANPAVAGVRGDGD